MELAPHAKNPETLLETSAAPLGRGDSVWVFFPVFASVLVVLAAYRVSVAAFDNDNAIIILIVPKCFFSFSFR